MNSDGRSLSRATAVFRASLIVNFEPNLRAVFIDDVKGEALMAVFVGF